MNFGVLVQELFCFKAVRWIESGTVVDIRTLPPKHSQSAEHRLLNGGALNLESTNLIFESPTRQGLNNMPQVECLLISKPLNQTLNSTILVSVFFSIIPI